MKFADLTEHQARKVNCLFDEFQMEAKALWFDSLPPKKQAKFTTLIEYEDWKLIDCQPTEDHDVGCEVADPSGTRFRFVIECGFYEWDDLKFFYRCTVPKEISWYIKDAALNDQLEPVDEDDGEELEEEEVIKQKRRIVRQQIRDDIRKQIRTAPQRYAGGKGGVYWQIVPEDFQDWKDLMGDEAIDYADFQYWEQKYVEAHAQLGIKMKPMTVRVSDVRKCLDVIKGPQTEDVLTLAVLMAALPQDAKFDVYHDLKTDRLRVCKQADEDLAGSKKEVPIPKHLRKLAGDVSGAEIGATYIPKLESSQ